MLSVDAAAIDDGDVASRMQCIYEAFIARVPYENLSNNRAVCEHPDDPESWPRATDKLLRENAAYGLGGTSFSLAYALRDVFRGAGSNAHCALGYNLVTEQAHAAVLVYYDDGPVLYDPALLMAGPIPVRPGGTLEDPLGTFALQPRCGPTLTVTLTLRPELRQDVTSQPAWVDPGYGLEDERAIYSVIPIPAAPHNYRQAWQASFYRGRSMPLRLARRVGNEIYRYGERPGSVEILRKTGREELCVDAEPVEILHEIFGIDTECLEDWYRTRT